MSMARFELAIFDPNGSLAHRLRLGAKAITIGRHPDNDIPIKDELASRFHCTVEPDGNGGYRARDLGSRNGTRINDMPVEDRPLRQGDRIQVGRHVFVVESSGGLDASSMDETHAPAGRENARPAREKRERAAATEATTVVSERRESGADDDIRPGMLPAWAKELLKLVEALTGGPSEMERVAIIDARGKGSEALKNDSGGSLALRLILQAVSKSRATDVHIEPKGDSTSVRFRVDGQMVNIASLPPQVGELTIGVVKAACHMKSAGRDAVHDGHFASRFPDRRVDYRASLTPSVHGQKLVLRVLDTRDSPRSLDDLGIPPYMLERVKRVCRQDSGLLLACGPTGSGKTTTLYNALREIDRDRRNVITIEDPVEYQLDRETQIPLDMGKAATSVDPAERAAPRTPT